MRTVYRPSIRTRITRSRNWPRPGDPAPQAVSRPAFKPASTSTPKLRSNEPQRQVEVRPTLPEQPTGCGGRVIVVHLRAPLHRERSSKDLAKERSCLQGHVGIRRIQRKERIVAAAQRNATIAGVGRLNPQIRWYRRQIREAA